MQRSDFISRDYIEAGVAGLMEANNEASDEQVNEVMTLFIRVMLNIRDLMIEVTDTLANQKRLTGLSVVEEVTSGQVLAPYKTNIQIATRAKAAKCA